MGSADGFYQDGFPMSLEFDHNSSAFQISAPRDPPPLIMEDTMKEVTLQVPTHPIPSMQGAFAESMLEASGDSTPTLPRQRFGNAAFRRQFLLDQDDGEETHAARWGMQKPDQKYHELWKLMSQISFGIYLLLNGIAKDDDQVMNILQGHVDEVDEFLEMTLEDFDLAQEDIDERLKFLKLPLENIEIFDAMLADRDFRLQIVSGNEKIEHVITRTASAMNAALMDVRQGLNACKEFTIYLAEEQEDPIWRSDRPDMEKVYDAMKGNVEGWYKAYVSLQTKGNHLGVALVQLGTIVAEMDRRAGEISRKTRFSISPKESPTISPPTSPQPQSREMRKSMLKTLPSDPTMITPAIRATLPAFQLVEDRERTPEPEARRSVSPEPEHFILAPRTYTPASASPVIPQIPITEPPAPAPTAAPEISKRSSLRQRFSLKRKDAETVAMPPPVSNEHQWNPRPRVHSTSEAQTRRPNPVTIPEHSNTSSIVLQDRDDTTVNTPPSRGLDSAYCSDFEKPLSPPRSHPALSSHPSPSPRHTPPIFTREFPIPSPRSDQQQYFRPVKASPNSPLQRPWTAAPSHHMHTSSSLSNLSKLSNGSHTRLPPSQLGLGDRRAAPSAMGMSMMSDMTTVTENGKRVKKKRSAFGWLKKAFALSEEEKAAFEQKRLQGVVDRDRYYEAPQQRWLDGKRVR